MWGKLEVKVNVSRQLAFSPCKRPPGAKERWGLGRPGDRMLAEKGPLEMEASPIQ